MIFNTRTILLILFYPINWYRLLKPLKQYFMFMVTIISFIIFYSVDNYIDDGSLHTDKTTLMYWVVGCTTQNLKKKNITKNKKRPKEQKIKLTTVSTMVNIKSRIMTRIQQCRQRAAMVVDESLPISVCLTIYSKVRSISSAGSRHLCIDGVRSTFCFKRFIRVSAVGRKCKVVNLS